MRRSPSSFQLRRAVVSSVCPAGWYRYTFVHICPMPRRTFTHVAQPAPNIDLLTTSPFIIPRQSQLSTPAAATNVLSSPSPVPLPSYLRTPSRPDPHQSPFHPLRSFQTLDPEFVQHIRVQLLHHADDDADRFEEAVYRYPQHARRRCCVVCLEHRLCFWVSVLLGLSGGFGGVVGQLGG